jgi:pilus assembly protein CpaC
MRPSAFRTSCAVRPTGHSGGAYQRVTVLPRIVVLFVAVLLGSLARPAMAAPQDLGPATARLSIAAGQGRMVRLDGVAKSVFVANPAVADIEVRSPGLVYVTAKAPGVTSLIAVDSYERLLANVEISVTYNEDQLRADIKRIVPAANVVVSTSGDALVLTGAAPSAADAETIRTMATRYVPDLPHLINRIAVDAPNQVNIRVRVAEISRDVVKSFGFNWGLGGRNGQFLFGFSSGTGTLTENTVGSAIGVTNTVTNVPNTNNVLLGYASTNIDFQVLIDALETEGLVKVLAEPNLTAISGAPATFLAGGEYPIPVPQALGVTTIEYKDYGVSLSFVATVTDGGRINLVVKPEVSQLSSQGSITLNGVNVPALTIRRASTTLDLGSGQSFAIAGLLQNNVTQSITRFPGLGNLPVLGALFRSDSFERDESELVIIVTPYLVRPTSGGLAAPIDGYVAPSDAGRVFLGADYTPQPAALHAPTGRTGVGLVGPGGFELE